jgi:hypothetical protein
MIAYLWSEVPWYSKFWSYTWNWSADWPFVYTGFKPRYLMVKRTDSSGSDWITWDSEMGKYNTISFSLSPNWTGWDNWTNNDEIDFLSNGFKMRNNWTVCNLLNATYIYAAFAELPFK